MEVRPAAGARSCRHKDNGSPALPTKAEATSRSPAAAENRAVEVDRTVNACGQIGLGGRQHPVGYHLAGRRVIVRLDHNVLHLLDTERTLLRSLPKPAEPCPDGRIRRAQPDIRGRTPASGPAGQLPRQRQHRPAEDPGRYRPCRPNGHRRGSRHHLPRLPRPAATHRGRAHHDPRDRPVQGPQIRTSTTPPRGVAHSQRRTAPCRRSQGSVRQPDSPLGQPVFIDGDDGLDLLDCLVQLVESPLVAGV